MALESVELIKKLFDEGWNRGNTSQRKPTIQDITTVDPGGKRLDLARSDAIVLYETAHNEEQPEVFYDFVHTRINVTVDARTMEGRAQLSKWKMRFGASSTRTEKAMGLILTDYSIKQELTFRTGRSGCTA